MHLSRKFGVNLNLPSSVNYLSQTRLVYLSGNVIVLHDLDTNEQKFIFPNEHCVRVTSVAINHKRTLIAVAEQFIKKEPEIFFYDLNRMKKRKVKLNANTTSIVLNSQNTESGVGFEFKSLDFSLNETHILALYGKSETNIGHLLIWSYAGSKLIVRMPLFYSSRSNSFFPEVAVKSFFEDVFKASFGPLKPKQQDMLSSTQREGTDSLGLSQHVLLSGKDYFKLFKFVDNSLKPNAIKVKKNLQELLQAKTYLCHCWLSDVCFLLATNDESVLLMKDRELLCNLNNSSTAKPYVNQCALISFITFYQKTMEGILTGFMLSTNSCKVYTFTENHSTNISKNSFELTKTFKLPGREQTKETFDSTNYAMVMSASVSPENDYVALVLNTNKIYTMMLHTTTLFEDTTEDHKVVTCAMSAYHGPDSPLHPSHVKDSNNNVFTKFSFSASLNEFAALSADHSLRIYNFDEKQAYVKLETSFIKPPLAMTFHPLSEFIIISFQQQLKCFQILEKELKLDFETSVYGCELVKFSHGGGCFAYNDGHERCIKVVSTYENKILASLAGHIIPPNDFIFSSSDRCLITAGNDGKCLKFNIFTGAMIGQFRLTIGAEVNQVFCLGYYKSPSLCWLNDIAVIRKEKNKKQRIQMISFVSDQQDTCKKHAKFTAFCTNYIIQEENGTVVNLDMAYSMRDRLINIHFFIVQMNVNKSCTALHAIISVQVDPDFKFELIRKTEISRERVTSGHFSLGGNSLVMSMMDGSLSVLKQKETAELQSKVVDDTKCVLVQHKELIDKQDSLKALEDEFKELKLTNEIKLRRLKAEADGEISLITSSNEKIQLQLENEAKELEHKMKTLQDAHMLEMQRQKQTLENKTQRLRDELTKKIIKEEKKKRELICEQNELKKSWELENIRLDTEHDATMNDMSKEFQEEMKTLAQQKEDLLDKLKFLKEQQWIEQRKSESQTDETLFTMRAKNAQQIQECQEIRKELMNESKAKEVTLSSLQEIEKENKNKLIELQEQEEVLQNKLKNLEKDKAGFKREIRERDETIGEKDVVIFDLKKKNQELEKFKFVLEYKINELKKEVEPQELEMNEKLKQLKEMEKELKCYHKNNFKLDQLVTELKLKLRAMKKSVKKQNAILAAYNAEAVERQTRIQMIWKAYNKFKNVEAIKNGVKELNAIYLHPVKNRKFSKVGKENDDSGMHNMREASSNVRERDFFERAMVTLRSKIEKEKKRSLQERKKILRERKTLEIENTNLKHEVKLFQKKNIS